MPTGRHIRAKNELFARRARETQNLRGAKHNARGLVHQHEEHEQKTPFATRALAIFLLTVLLGGGTSLLTVVMELVYMMFRS